MQVLRKQMSEDDDTYCYACNSPIEDSISRGLYVENEKGEQFHIRLHYFPPCSQKELPKTWKSTAKSLTYQLDDLLKKYPDLSKQLNKIDDEIMSRQKTL